MNLPSDIYQGLHILLVTEDDARGKALTKVLRDHQARVGDLKSGGRDPAALRGIDVAIIDGRFKAAAEARLNEMRGDVRARFASVVHVDFEALIKADGSVLLPTLSEQLAPLVELDRKLAERARTESNFSTSLSPLGPSRTLRALSMSGHTLLVELRNPTLQASVEVSNELLVSASAARADKRWEAWSALVRILGLSEAEVFVSRRSFTSAMNIMEPVDQALEVAAQERHCSAPQIADEEAEALRLSQAPAARATAAGASRDSLPPRGASLNPGYTPPRPPGKSVAPVSPVSSQQRTLLGSRPGLPAMSSRPVANDTGSELASPSLPAAKPEAPRYAHRPGAIPNQRPGMTLLGVAPGSIPGLAELRAQAEQAEKLNKAAKADQPGARADKGLASAPTQVALPPAKPPPAPVERPGLARAPESALRRERAAFDAPTGRALIGDQLLDTLDDMDDLSDELSMTPSALSAPLPPPREAVPEPAEADDLDEDQTDSGESRERLTERAPRPSEEDLFSETFPTPTNLRSQLLARTDALAKTERAPAPSDEIETSPGKHPAFPEPPTRSYPVRLDATVLGSDDESSEPPNARGEVTLVTQRGPEKRKSRVGALSAAAVLLGLTGLLVHSAMRARDNVARRSEAPASATAPAEPAVVAAPAVVEAPAAVPAAQAPVIPPAAAVTTEPAAPPAPKPTSPPVGSPDAPVAAARGGVARQPVLPAAQPAAPTTVPAGDLADLLRQGQRMLAERNPAGARPAFEQALTLDAANPHARAGLGETLLRLNEPGSALPQAQAATKLRPRRARYQVLLGDVLSAMGKLDDAQAAWRKALALDANDSEAKQRLSR